MADGPRAGEQRNVAVARGQQRRAGKGGRGGAIAVEHGVDLLGGGHVGSGDCVVAELRDAQASAFDGDGVDGVAGVLLLRGGDAAQVAGQALAVEAALEDLGVGDWAVGACGVVHAVQGEGRGVQVALGVDSGGVDEVLVVRAACNRRALEVGRCAQRPQVEVDDGVGLRQQAGDLRRGMLAQPHGGNQRHNQRQHQKQRVERPFPHPALYCTPAAD